MVSSPLSLKPLNLYRVTTKYPGFDSNKVGSFSHPPIDSSNMQRTNIIGNPVLYCSDNKNTLIKECEVKVGDTFYLSEWELSLENI